MNEYSRILLLIVLLFCSLLNGKAQETEIKLINKEKTIKKDEIQSVNYIEKDFRYIDLIKVSNDTLTFMITNLDLKNELYNNQEKRDALTSLPGIISLSLFSKEPSFTVIIKRFYAEKYLQTKFDICEKEAIEILRNIEK
jgi:hypothetical protein